MNRSLLTVHSMAGATFLVVAPPAGAAVTSFTSSSQWQSAAGAFSGITFAEVPTPTILTTQYASLGVAFTGANDSTAASFGAFMLDGKGLLSSPDGNVELSFSQPMTSIGVDYISSVQFKLFSQGTLIHTSGFFFGPSTTHFAGLVSTVPFDAAIIFDPDPAFGVGHVCLDSLYFGPPIPGPGSLPLLMLGMLGARRRR